tara:strand:+ start:965 stop:1558 length:594 start_codon:yes stop_codon:yes gene_type:complete
MKKLGVLILFALLIFPLFTTLAIAAETDTEKTDSKLNTALNADIQIPPELILPTKIVFGLNQDDNISLSLFIILISTWILFFIVIYHILSVTPWFKEGWKLWLGSIAVTLLIAITGAIKSLANFYFNIGNIFEFLERWSAGAVFFAIILLALSGWLINKVTNIMKTNMAIDEAEETGQNIGLVSTVGKAYRKSAERK